MDHNSLVKNLLNLQVSLQFAVTYTFSHVTIRLFDTRKGNGLVEKTVQTVLSQVPVINQSYPRISGIFHVCMDFVTTVIRDLGNL